MQPDATPLIRKQYLVSQKNVPKLERLAKHKRTSATAIVREAIDASNPEGFDALNDNELITVASIRLKEAIQGTVE